MLALLPEWLDPVHLIEAMGAFALLGVLFIVFAECGLLVGFFLPGDSLLFTAGLFVASGTLDYPLWLVCLLIVLAAVAGNLVGYGVGRRLGPPLFERPDSRLFKREYVDKTHAFFERYGARAIILARFVPIVRTFITATAGIARMDFRPYAIYSTLGGILWGAGLTVLGYFLGQVAFVRDNLELMLVAIVAVSVVPIVVELVRARRELARERAYGVDNARGR